MALPDEYTALQKYISTYRDPKAADSEANQAKNAADAGKGKPWWQVSNYCFGVISSLGSLTFLQFWRSGSSSQAADNDEGVVPDSWLDADIKQGISNNDVETRRKRMGWNEISTEKENLFIKFLMFFTGPVLYGMLFLPTDIPDGCFACFAHAMARCSSCFAFCKALPQLELRAHEARSPHHTSALDMKLISWHSHGNRRPDRRRSA